jgi:hypothetical protein
MRRVILLLAACFSAVAVIVALGAPSPKVGRELHGTVGPGFTISLDDQEGQPVTSLRPGTYWLTVDDFSAMHNFHIFGPGLNEVVTSVPFVGTVTLKIHLRHGGYTFQCDPHPSSMRGTFEVGGVGQVD